MRCNLVELARLLMVGTLLASVRPLPAAPPIDLVLPDTTRVCILTGDLDELLSSVERSHFGRMWNDPRMKPFADHVRHHPDTLWATAERNSGTTLGELRDIAVGETAIAMVELSQNRFAVILLSDAGGNEPQAEALITRAAERLRRRGATSSSRELAGTSLRVFDLPGTNGQPKQMVYFLKEGLLGIANDRDLVKLVLSRWPGSRPRSLASLPAYRDVMDRCEREASGLPFHLRWFCDPVKLSKWMHEPDPGLDGEDDPELAARRHGIFAVRGLGGLVSLNVDGLDLVHQTSVFAPPPRESSMQALTFRPGGEYAPLPWIPADVSSYMTLHMDLTGAFDHCAVLFDDLYADGIEGTFEGLLEDLRAANGPQVDVRRDLVMYLGNRITSIGQYVTPVSRTSEGNILVFETKEERRVAAAIEALFRDDPGAVRIKVDGHEHDLWVVGEDRDAPFGEGGREFLTSGVMVTRGHLLIATNFEFIRRLLSTNAGRLADAGAFRDVMRKLHELGDEDIWLKTFSPLQRDLYTSYEILRLGNGEDSESMYVRVILELLSAAAETGSDATRIDFGLLPHFDNVKHYLGSSGMIGRNHEKGWILEGVIIPPTQ